MAKCMFVDEWNCPVQRDEFPLEVCKICIKARSIQNDSTKIQVPEDGKKVKEKARNISTMIKEAETSSTTETKKKDLTRENLNKRFHEGELSVEEYIEKRKNLPKVSKQS